MSPISRALSLALLFPVALASANAFARGRVLSDDSELSPPQTHASGRFDVPQQIPADAVRTVTSSGPLTLRVIRLDHGTETPVVGLPLAKFRTCDQKNGTRAEIVLQNQWYQVSASEHVYSIIADVPCTGTHELLFQQDSNGGQALGIWQVAERARLKLEKEIGLGFWKRKITFEWPSVGDFYVYDSVNLTRGDAWDVVGHEMGHAIYDQGQLGTFGGGEHKIDECYSADLALSEGWASFFSGWVNLSLDDADAKFEYMVPRRAPIRIENIPADVCKGEKNEWRVTGFFWDLVDSHDDGEKVQTTFASMWKALNGTKVSSASEARAQLEKAGMGSADLATIWQLNFLTSE